MALNTTVLHPGQAISVTLDEWNTFDSFNNVTASSNWLYSGFQPTSPCAGGLGLPSLPFTVGIVPGYYSGSNLSMASSLPIFYPPSYNLPDCIVAAPPTEYDFSPHSDQTAAYFSKSFGAVFNGSIATTLSFTSYYSSSPDWLSSITPVISFPPGVYTIIGGDEWNQLVVLHFIVVQQ